MTEERVQPLDVLASPVRREILDTLTRLPHLSAADAPNRSTGLSAADLTERLGLHVTTVRFHLERLEQAGLIEAHDERVGVGRPRRRFTPHPGRLTDVEAPGAYRLVAEVLAAAMASGGTPDAAEAGRHWAREHALAMVGADRPDAPEPARTPGAWLARVGVVLDVLDRWGYQPTVATTDAGRTAQLCLHRCPLRQLAVDNPAVACGIHRGVIQGTLEALGEPDAVVSLLPFVEPELCIADVTAPTSFTQPPSPQTPCPDRPTERPAR